jgi:hypothetical protein
MSDVDEVSAVFDSVRYATAAVDWFRNQATDPGAISILALPPGRPPRPTQSGDNQRADLSWLVSIDVNRAPFGKRTAIETFKREGGRPTRGRAVTGG